METTYHLEWRWGVSRGRDTYGYNICTLYVNGARVASCNGGGYDMQGSCLGEWIGKAFPDGLKRLSINRPSGRLYGLHFYRLKPKGGHTTYTRWREGMRVTIDGACGINSMFRILNAMGWREKYVPVNGKNRTVYMLTGKVKAAAS